MSASVFNVPISTRLQRFAASAIVLLLVMLPTVIRAHESRTVATDFAFVVGFVSEPAVQNDTNGLSLSITKADQPVLNAQDTLKAQVIFGDQTRDLTLSPAFGEEGAYESVFIPTQPGDYTFRVYGTLDGVNIDESFTSSPEGFDSVAARTDLEFPGVPANGKTNDDVTTVALPVGAGIVILAIVGIAFNLRRRTQVA
jgi:hypothetical protein